MIHSSKVSKLLYSLAFAFVLVFSCVGVGVESREISNFSLVNATATNANTSTTESLNASLSNAGDETRQARGMLVNLNPNPNPSQIGVGGRSDAGKIAVSTHQSQSHARSFVPYPLQQQVIYSNGLPYLVYETDVYEPDYHYEPYYYEGVPEYYESSKQSIYVLREVTEDEEEAQAKSSSNPNSNPNKEPELGQSQSDKKQEAVQTTRPMRAPAPKIQPSAPVPVQAQVRRSLMQTQPKNKEQFLRMFPFSGGFGGFPQAGPGSYYPQYDYDYGYGMYPPPNYDNYYY